MQHNLNAWHGGQLAIYPNPESWSLLALCISFNDRRIQKGCMLLLIIVIKCLDIIAHDIYAQLPLPVTECSFIGIVCEGMHRRYTFSVVKVTCRRFVHLIFTYCFLWYLGL